MRWSLRKLRQGLEPEGIFESEIPQATVEGDLTDKDIGDAIFRFGWPLGVRINGGMLHALAKEEHVRAFLAELPRLGERIKILYLERLAPGLA